MHSSSSTGISRTRKVACSQVDLIAQLGEHCTGIAEFMGSNPFQAWKRFYVCSSQVDNDLHYLRKDFGRFQFRTKVFEIFCKQCIASLFKERMTGYKSRPSRENLRITYRVKAAKPREALFSRFRRFVRLCSKLLKNCLKPPSCAGYILLSLYFLYIIKTFCFPSWFRHFLSS